MFGPTGLTEGSGERRKQASFSFGEVIYAPFRVVTSLFNGRRSALRGNGDTPSENFIWALKEVSFEVKKGEVVGVIGRRGVENGYKLGFSPEEIADKLGHLTLAQVYAALAYYPSLWTISR